MSRRIVSFPSGVTPVSCLIKVHSASLLDIVHISFVEILKILITISVPLQKIIDRFFSILSLLFGEFSLSPILVIFILNKVSTFLLKTILAPHLLYGKIAVMILTKSTSMMRRDFTVIQTPNSFHLLYHLFINDLLMN